MGDAIGKVCGVEINRYDVCQVSDDGGATWGDFATIRDQSDLGHAVSLVRDGGGVNGHRKADYRIKAGRGFRPTVYVTRDQVFSQDLIDAERDAREIAELEAQIAADLAAEAESTVPTAGFYATAGEIFYVTPRGTVFGMPWSPADSGPDPVAVDALPTDATPADAFMEPSEAITWIGRVEKVSGETILDARCAAAIVDAADDDLAWIEREREIDRQHELAYFLQHNDLPDDDGPI